MASENIKFLDTTEARLHVLVPACLLRNTNAESKKKLRHVRILSSAKVAWSLFPPDDDRESRLLVRSFDHHTQHNAPRESCLIQTGEDMSILPSKL